MGTEHKITPKHIVELLIVILGLICVIFTVSNYYQINIGSNTVINNIFQGGDNSQTNPPVAANVPPTATPTQQSTAPTPNSNNNNNDGDSSTPTSIPTPKPTQTPTPTTELSFGVPVSGTITPDIRLNRYSIVVPQAGRLTINVTKGSPIAPSYLKMRLMNSNDETIKSVNDVFSTGGKTYNVPIDLEAGTYYIQLEEYVFLYNSGSPSLSNGAYTLTVKFVPF